VLLSCYDIIFKKEACYLLFPRLASLPKEVQSIRMRKSATNRSTVRSCVAANRFYSSLATVFQKRMTRKSKAATSSFAQFGFSQQIWGKKVRARL
jgi:hypothetical protein